MGLSEEIIGEENMQDVLGESKSVTVARDRLRDASSVGRWMSASWSVDDGRVVLHGVVTSNFPVGDFDAAVDLLKEELVKFSRLAEANPPKPEPLPVVDFTGDDAE